MRRSAPRLVRALAALVLLVLPARAAFATCGAEGCPCVRRGLADNAGRFAFDLRVLDVTQDRMWSGGHEAALDDVLNGTFTHGSVELLTRTRAWSAEGRMQVNDRLRVSATLPWVEREHRHYKAHVPVYIPELVESWSYRGLGDATLLAQWNAGQLPFGTRTTVQGGVKLPTGRRHVKNAAGTEPEPSLRPGSGSTDLIAGASASQALPWQPLLPLSANVLRRWNTRGTDGYRAGDELQASVSTGYVIRPWLTFTALGNYSSHGSDAWPADASDPYREPAHAGGKALFVTPGLSASVGGGVTLYALWQNRVWGRSTQPMVVARDYIMLGTSVSLGR